VTLGGVTFRWSLLAKHQREALDLYGPAKSTVWYDVAPFPGGFR